MLQGPPPPCDFRRVKEKKCLRKKCVVGPLHAQAMPEVREDVHMLTLQTEAVFWDQVSKSNMRLHRNPMVQSSRRITQQSSYLSEVRKAPAVT